MPETKWYLAKKEVKSGGDMKVQHSDYNTKLNCKSATRGDSGRYTITAENVNGKDVAEVEVIVLSVPTPPGGPLKVYTYLLYIIFRILNYLYSLLKTSIFS